MSTLRSVGPRDYAAVQLEEEVPQNAENTILQRRFKNPGIATGQQQQKKLCVSA